MESRELAEDCSAGWWAPLRTKTPSCRLGRLRSSLIVWFLRGTFHRQERGVAVSSGLA